MGKNSLRYIAIIFFFILPFISEIHSFSAENGNTPVIQIDQTEYSFPTAFVGETLSHTFTVYNKGKVDLHIKDVTHSWGCFVARFDRVIPPGGTGNITLTIDTNIVMGKFRKRTVVWSDDPDRRSMALYLLGEVKPYISVEPEDSLSFIGVKGKVPPQHINMLNNTKDPIKITKIENPLMDHIRYKLNEVKPGYVYSLEIEDISQVNGDYVGHLSVHTDHSQMSELIIMIRGQISD